MRRKTKVAPVVYQLKVTLKYSKPKIWRRFQLAGDTTFADLHFIIQRVMGWCGCHMHDFCINGQFYGDTTQSEDLGFAEEGDFTLDELLEPKTKFIYHYDFGDDWTHEILVEKSFEPESGVVYPQCLKGEQACPPEDCGGIPGYYRMLEIIKDPNHPEHRSIKAWLGYEFDPAEFSVKWVNKQLAEFQKNLSRN